MTPISGIEFLVWLLIAAAIIAMLAARLRIPYTVCLVMGGLLLGVIRIPILSPLQSGHRQARGSVECRQPTCIEQTGCAILDEGSATLPQPDYGRIARHPLRTAKVFYSS